MLYNKLNMDDLPASESADILVENKETPQAPNRSEVASPTHGDHEARQIEAAFDKGRKEGSEEEAPTAPPESQAQEETEKLPQEDKLKDLPKEAEETGVEAAKRLAVPQSTKASGQSQTTQPQEEVLGKSVAVPPLTSKLIAWTGQRSLEQERVLKKAA